MFDHVGVVFKDLKRSADLYRQLLEPLGIRVMEDHTQRDGTGWLVFSTGAPESPFFVVAAGRPSFWTPATEAGAGERPGECIAEARLPLLHYDFSGRLRPDAIVVKILTRGIERE
jgi:catechol 2,3-dioxygenase-like lactoylglutathione lyase family enzyme